MGAAGAADGFPKAALLRVPTAVELTSWDYPSEAGSAPFRSAADALEIIAKTYASDYGVSEPGDDDESYQRLLVGARDCGRHMFLSDPVQREQLGKVALAALLAAAWALTIAELNESMAIVNAAWKVVEDIWLGDDPVRSLELLRAFSRLERHCGRLQRRISRHPNTLHPGISPVIRRLSTAYLEDGQSMVAAHGQLAEAMVSGVPRFKGWVHVNSDGETVLGHVTRQMLYVVRPLLFGAD